MAGWKKMLRKQKAIEKQEKSLKQTTAKDVDGFANHEQTEVSLTNEVKKLEKIVRRLRAKGIERDPSLAHLRERFKEVEDSLRQKQEELRQLTFKGRNHIKTEHPKVDPSLEPIIECLTSTSEDVFWQGIESACTLSEEGSNKGYLAIKEAILRKLKANDCQLYEPQLTLRTGDAYDNLEDEILEMARNLSLLKEAYRAGELISKYNSLHSNEDIKRLSEKVRHAAGIDQFISFTLIYNYMRCFAQVRNK